MMFLDRLKTARTKGAPKSTAVQGEDSPEAPTVSIRSVPVEREAESSGDLPPSHGESEVTALVRVPVNCPVSGNLAQFLATGLVVEKSQDFVAVWFHHVLEWVSFFSVIYLAQWTSDVFLLLVLLAMYCLAAIRAGSLRAPIQRPIYMLVPERHSGFGLCNTQQSAMFYQISAATLRLGSLVLWAVLTSNLPDHEGICVVPVTGFVDSAGCQHVPTWLSSGCGTFFGPEKWQHCMAQSWIRYGYCNLLAAQCRNQELGYVSLPISILFSSSISLLSVVAPFLWLGSVLWLSVQKGVCVFNTPKNMELAIAVREAEINLAEDFEDYQVFMGPFLRRLMRWDLALVPLDLLTDLLIFVVFASAKNWTLALLQLLILSSSGITLAQLKGKEKLLWPQLEKAYRSGVFTEVYLNLVLMERTRRCPLSLFLQVYGSMFVTGSFLVSSIFSLGILTSLLSAVQGGFLHIHLDLQTGPRSLNL